MSRFTTKPGEPRQRFRVGSTYFFGDQGTDTDWIEFEDQPRIYKNVLQFRRHDRKECLFRWRKMTPEEFVEYELKTNLPMELGKFLIPEVCEYLGFTMDHLRALTPLSERLDARHAYEKIIFDAYIQNGEMRLTAEQRGSAFLEYKRERNE